MLLQGLKDLARTVLYTALLLFGSIVIFIIIFFVWSAPSSLESVRRDFLRNQPRIDELVQVYEKNTGVAQVFIDWIGRSEFDGIIGKRGDLSIRWRLAVSPEPRMPTIAESKYDLKSGSARLYAVLENIAMTPEQLNAILTAMRNADVRGIGFGGWPDRRFIVVNYPDTGGDFHCTWMFVTPLNSVSITELAQQGFVTDEAEGEEGPYILNDKWLAYKQCVS